LQGTTDGSEPLVPARRGRPRRDPGDGAVFQRGNGRWVARLQLPDGSKRYFYGRTKEDVRRRLREAQRSLEAGRLPADMKVSLGVYLQHWLDSLPATDLKPRTIGYYRQYVRTHLAGTEFARKPLARITPQDLRELYARKLAGGLSRSTVHHLHAVLHRALAVAEREGAIPRNVADLVDGPGYGKTALHVLTGDQPERLIEAVAGEPLEALFILAVTSGMRQGELLALPWDNVDLDHGELEVVGSLSGQRRAEQQVVTPKTGKGRRVSLAPVAVAALREHRRRQTELRLALGEEWHDRGLVFCDAWRNFGDYARPAALNRALDRVLFRAGLPRIRFHDLRHTAATRMLSRGVHPKIASEMLGHSSIHVTLDRYSHVTSTMQGDAVRLAWGESEPNA
jgi:integrase